MAASIITSVVTGGSNNHATVSEEANAYSTDFVSQGVLGSITNTNGPAPTTGSFGVNQNTGSDMNLLIKGTGNTTSTYSTAYITCTPATQDIQVLRARMASDYTPYAINSNSTGSTVYDWIYLKADATKANTPGAAADDVITLFTSRSTLNTSDNGSPPTYGILLAVVTVANGATAITNANITDKRTQATFNTGTSVSTTGWNNLNFPLTFSSLNGNRSYNLTTPNDLTGILTPGMRLNVTRSVTPPTQCTSLNGTTQFYSRASASVAGMTFTNNFVVSTWIKVTSYGTSQLIASRFNGTSGWDLSLNAAGQVQLAGRNGGQSNLKAIISYQSVPLNKWVHVAAQLDMTSSTNSPTVNYVMIDGVDVPASQATGGTNPTTLIQLGNLEIGSWNGGALPFGGEIAQVAIYSAKVTEANIRLTIPQTLVGTETSLISAYTFNNSINDLNANGNNLTANGGAVATTVDSPFSSIEYGIITRVVYSNPTTTLTVQSPEGGCFPNITLNSPQYSNVKVPFGFPAQESKWKLYSLLKTDNSQASATSGTWYNLGNLQLSIPIGEWSIRYEGFAQATNGSAGQDQYTTLSTANNTENSQEFTTRLLVTQGNNVAAATFYRSGDVSLSSQTSYYLNHRAVANSSTTISVLGTVSTILIGAKCSYL